MMQTNWAVRCACVVAATIAMAQSPTSSAGAQQKVAETEIEQRMKFKQLVSPGQSAPSREQVVDELIEEKFKIENARRWGEEVSDQAVDQTFAEMARRMGRTAEQVTEDLARKGVDVATLKHRIRADLAWQKLVRLQYLRPGRVEQPRLRGPTGDFWWLDDRERNYRR